MHQVCRIVFISRHPCGCSESILRQRRIRTSEYISGLDDLTLLGDEWGKTHAAVLDKFSSHPEWIWVRLEDLSCETTKKVQVLYGKIGLEWTTESDDFYGTKRNSKTQINKWRDALTSEEIEAIRRGCAPHGTGLYESF